MLFSIFLYFSQQTVQAEISAHINPSNLETVQSDVEDVTRVENEALSKTSIYVSTNSELCSESKGRKLFRSAIIGIPVGTVTLLGGGVWVLAAIDSSTASAVGAIGTVYAGLGTLAFSSIALPISVHMLYNDAVKKNVEPGVSLGELYVMDGMLVLGGALTGFVPVASFLVPLGYIFNFMQGVTILDSINMKRKQICKDRD